MPNGAAQPLACITMIPSVKTTQAKYPAYTKKIIANSFAMNRDRPSFFGINAEITLAIKGITIGKTAKLLITTTSQFVHIIRFVQCVGSVSQYE